MFELTLSISIDKQKNLLDFQKKLIEENGDFLDVIVSHNANGRTFLAMAVEDSKKEYLKAKVLDGVLNIIVSIYKYNFFKDLLLCTSSSVMIKPFLKAISIFDADSDLEIIKKEISFEGEILIDSFFYFKLQTLKVRWEKTASIILKNAITQSDSAMMQVIRYLSESSENFTLIANVKVSDKRLIIKNYKGTKSYSASQDGLAKFLTEIISLNPLKINLTRAFEINEQNKACEILNEIFGEKIYIQN